MKYQAVNADTINKYEALPLHIKLLLKFVKEKRTYDIETSSINGKPSAVVQLTFKRLFGVDYILSIKTETALNKVTPLRK